MNTDKRSQGGWDSPYIPMVHPALCAQDPVALWPTVLLHRHHSPHLAGEAVKTQPHSQPRSPSSRALGSRLHTQFFLLHVEAGRAARNRDGWGNVKEWMSGQLAR